MTRRKRRRKRNGMKTRTQKTRMGRTKKSPGK
jgi:hypothetical protein